MFLMSHKVWCHNDFVMLCEVMTRSMTVWRVNFSTFLNTKKMAFFNISLGAQLAYKIYPIKFYTEWLNLNTVKISFCKVAVPLVKFVIKCLKMTEKHQNKATLPIFSTYNTREGDKHRQISVNHENRNVRHTKKRYDAFVHWLIFSPIYKADSGGSWTFSFAVITLKIEQDGFSLK